MKIIIAPDSFKGSLSAKEVSSFIACKAKGNFPNAEILEIPLVGIIPEDTGIITSTNKGDPIVNNEEALAGKAYRNVAQRILGEEVPFLDLDEPKGFVAKIKNVFAKLKAKV